MPKPINLDVRKKPWPLTKNIQTRLKAIVCINLATCHYTNLVHFKRKLGQIDGIEALMKSYIVKNN